MFWCNWSAVEQDALISQWTTNTMEMPLITFIDCGRETNCEVYVFFVWFMASDFNMLHLMLVIISPDIRNAPLHETNYVMKKNCFFNSRTNILVQSIQTQKGIRVYNYKLSISNFSELTRLLVNRLQMNNFSWPKSNAASRSQFAAFYFQRLDHYIHWKNALDYFLCTLNFELRFSFKNSG